MAASRVVRAAVCRRLYRGNMHDASFPRVGGGSTCEVMCRHCRAWVSVRLAPVRRAELGWMRGHRWGGLAVPQVGATCDGPRRGCMHGVLFPVHGAAARVNGAWGDST